MNIKEFQENFFDKSVIFFSIKIARYLSAPFDVRLPEGDEADDEIITVVQPDISVICDPAKLDNRGCRGAPDFIIEILSPATAGKDQIQKVALYEKHGVKEYWLVHPGDRLITVRLLDSKADTASRNSGGQGLWPCRRCRAWRSILMRFFGGWQVKVNNLQSLKLIGAGLVGAKLLMEKPDLLPPPMPNLSLKETHHAAKSEKYSRSSPDLPQKLRV